MYHPENDLEYDKQLCALFFSTKQPFSYYEARVAAGFFFKNRNREKMWEETAEAKENKNKERAILQ